MRLFEFEGKEALARQGVQVPGGAVAASPDEAGRVARDLDRPVVVKAQVLSGGRGRAALGRAKAGGGQSRLTCDDVWASGCFGA